MARAEAMKKMCKCHRIVYLEQIHGSLPSISVDLLLVPPKFPGRYWVVSQYRLLYRHGTGTALTCEVPVPNTFFFYGGYGVSYVGFECCYAKRMMIIVHHHLAR